LHKDLNKHFPADIFWHLSLELVYELMDTPLACKLSDNVKLALRSSEASASLFITYADRHIQLDTQYTWSRKESKNLMM